MSNQFIDQRIAAIAAESPRRLAVTAIDVRRGSAKEVTWSEFDERTSRLAALLAHAARGGTPWPVWFPAASTLTGVTALIAGLRAGLTVVPLDATAPPAARARQVAAIAGVYGGAVSMEDLAPMEGLAPVEDMTEQGRPVGAARTPAATTGGWVLLTGGTTGQPKPVPGPGSPVWHSTRGAPLLLQHAGWRPRQIQLILGPLHHAAPFSSFIEGILSGNTLVMANGFYPQLIFETVHEYGVEWTQLTPVHMRMAEPLLGTVTLRGLRSVLHTAAPCPEPIKRAWIDELGPGRVFEMYAATEGIGTTLCSGTEWSARPGTVGRGFMTRIRIVGPDGRELPAGDVGEIQMRTVQPRSAARAIGFRSVGDHGRLDAEGYLYLSGRADDLVIIGGENVYLSEVEAVLSTLDGVDDTAVTRMADDTYGERLHAYVVPKSGHQLDHAALTEHCRRELAAYKVPRSFEVARSLPRNAAGKLLRHIRPTSPPGREGADLASRQPGNSM